MKLDLNIPLDDIVGAAAIGRRVRQIRESEKLTQEKFAERIGATRTQLKNWETGITRPKFEEIYRISVEFGADFNFICVGDDSTITNRLAQALRGEIN